MTSDGSQTRWRGALARVAACALLVVLLGVGPPVALAGEQVQITDPYIELHTGPGRGYPVFFVAERNEKIEILLRHTDWYKVRTDSGQEGWVNRTQLETTLTAAGTAKVFRDVLVDDYLRRRLEMGAAWGLFDSEPMVKIWGGYRFADALSIEVTIGQVQGTFAGTELWNVNLNVEPWSDRRFSPFFGVGLGRFHNIPNLSLVNAVETTANLANAAVGLRYYIADRFVARLDYSIYSAYTSDLSSTEYRAATLGLAFFF